MNFTKPLIHKSLYGSSTRDVTKTKNKRTTYCEQVIDAHNVISNWSKVTCKECLKLRGGK
jgi:hypothetical protein